MPFCDIGQAQHKRKVFGAGREKPTTGPMNCQKCNRPWHAGPKVEVMIPQTDGNWEKKMWCLGCVVKQGNLEMLEVG
jgi:hypothetical protein